MFWFTNLFSSKNSNFSENTIEKNYQKNSLTLKDLKLWCKEELPALGWQKLKLRISKQAKEKCNFCLDEVPDDTIIPEDLLILIDSTVSELFNKKFLK